MSRALQHVKSLRLGTRRSALALRQTEMVVAALRSAHTGLDIAIVPIVTTGDRVLDVPLAGIGDRGLFVREIENALLEGTIDLAVHSLKDLPSVQPEGLTIAAIPTREDPRDVLVSRLGSLDELPPATRIGSSSLRRAAQVRHRRPDVNVESIRGNVDTRLRKLDEGEFDAIILARAGLNRLGIANAFAHVLPVDVMLPAVGQGALAIETRAADRETIQVVQALHDPSTAAAVRAERAFMRALEGGCQVPFAAHATLGGDALRIDGLIASLDGRRLVRDAVEGTSQSPETAGALLAERLLAAGGDRILRELRGDAA